MKKFSIYLFAVFLSFVSFVTFGQALNAKAQTTEDRICKGVFINQVDISGMTKKEAQDAMDQYLSDLRSKSIAIFVDDSIVYTTMGDLGYTYEPNDYIEQALSLGKSGNLIKRYKDMKDIEQGKVVYPLTFTYNENRLRELLEIEASAYNIAPVNASFSRVNGEFVYKEHKLGSKVDIEETYSILKDKVDHWNGHDITMSAVMVDDMPAFTIEDLKKSKDIIGEFTTDFKTSNEGRAANIDTGARFINNSVLYPGEVFSCQEVLEPFTLENGYFFAGAYSDGEIIDSIGGGSCQTTTTFYNAILNAELEVVERYAHSMTVSYVPLSFDAAIADGVKDFKFRNNTDLPILIEAFTKDRKLTIRIWGQEKRDVANRKIVFEEKVVAEIDPPADIITKDPTKPTSYKKITQKAKKGYRAELYKVVYENGVEVSRTLVNKSSYRATPNHVTIGTKKK